MKEITSFDTCFGSIKLNVHPKILKQAEALNNGKSLDDKRTKGYKYLLKICISLAKEKFYRNN